MGRKGTPIGINQNLVKVATEGKDAKGRDTFINKEEVPTRIDEVSETLIYLGWAVYGTLETDPLWKIKRMSQDGTVWKQEYADGNEYYRNKWSDRAILNYE